MTTFVLVHGAWNGAHGFRFVRPILLAAGHEVFTPSLTGIGERVHLAHSGINLSTHIRDVVNTILYEDLTDIVLLGLSYRGAVVTGAVEHVADRIRHLVYVDALVPTDGQSVLSLSGVDRPRQISLGETGAFRRRIATSMIQGSRRSSHTQLAAAGRDLSRTVPRHRPTREPLLRFDLHSCDDRSRGGTRQSGVSSPRPERAHQTGPRWQYIELDTGHMIPMNRPDDLAQILLDLN